MSYFTDKITNLEGPEIIFKTELNGKKIEIFAEEHNSLLPKKNLYQELIKHRDYPKALVLVEHATVLCDLNLGDDEKFQEIIKASGSEYVFYHSLKEQLNPVICVDNRIEMGLMSRIEEKFLLDVFNYLNASEASVKTRDSIKNVLKRFKILVKQFPKIQASGENQDYYSDFKDLYELYQEIFSRQITILDKLLAMNISELKKKDIVSGLDITNYQFAVIILEYLYQNILQISSLTVDINVLNILNQILKESESENVLIFTGLNHSIRLFTFINKSKKSNDVDKTIMSKRYLELGNNYIADRFTKSNPFPFFNKNIEETAIKSLKNKK